MEQSIAILVEEAIQDLEGIDQITSRSAKAAPASALRWTPLTIPGAAGRYQSRVDAINNFPADAEKPVISLVTRRRESFRSPSQVPMLKEIRQLAEQVRDDLLRTLGITQVELDSGTSYEIAIEVPEERLRQYGITLAGGETISKTHRTCRREISRRRAARSSSAPRERPTAGDQFEQVAADPRRRKPGQVRDLARVTDGFEENPLRSRFNGMMAAFVDVYRVGDQSAIDVADKVIAYVEGRQRNLPDGVTVTTWRDRSRIVKKRLQTLTYNALQGGALVLLLLTLFYGLRSLFGYLSVSRSVSWAPSSRCLFRRHPQHIQSLRLPAGAGHSGG